MLVCLVALAHYQWHMVSNLIILINLNQIVNLYIYREFDLSVVE